MDWVAYEQQKFNSQSWEAGKSKALADPVSGHRGHLLCPHMVEGARELSGVSVIRALISFMRVPPS